MDPKEQQPTKDTGFERRATNWALTFALGIIGALLGLVMTIGGYLYSQMSTKVQELDKRATVLESQATGMKADVEHMKNDLQEIKSDVKRLLQKDK